jgi:uncharacterized protein
MFYFGMENDQFTQVLTQFEFGGSEPRFDENLFGANPHLRLIPAETVACDSKVMVLEKHTGSWCFLEPIEHEMFKALDGRMLDEVATWTPDAYKAQLPEFVARLYWRGLLEINERRFIEASVFDQGPIRHAGVLFVMVPTERCNLACKYCAVKADPSRQERMEWPIAQRAMDLIIDTIPDRGLVEFAGGEALLEIGLMERIVEYGNQSASKVGKQLEFRAQSNGTLLTQELLDRIKNSGISVNVSLDGDRASNDMTRVFPGNKGTHAAITRTIDLMHKNSYAPGLICVVSKANYRRLNKVLAHYAKLGMDWIKLNPVSRHGRATQGWDELVVEPEEFLEAHIKYLDLVLQEKCSVLDENTSMMLQILGNKVHPYRCMRSQCGTGRDFMTIAPNGDVYPCPQTRVNPEFRLANILEVDRLNDVWKNNPIISKLSERQVGTISKCKACNLKRFCEAGCPIASYEHFGTTDAIHPWCEYYKGIYSELFRRLGESSRLVETFCSNAKVYDYSFFARNAA